MINYLRLESELPTLTQKFSKARPFPHVVIEGLFSDDDLTAAIAEWPAADDPSWKSSQRGKRGMSAGIPPLLGAILTELNSERFVCMLAALTGIADLSPDHTLGGAGLHEIAPGGSLQMHVDFNRLGTLYRRLNVLLYLNVGWQPEWRGALELWDQPKNPREPVVIEPLFNRLVIAESSDRSWHGHPHPLDCPDGICRRSLATYYYSRTPHESYSTDHSTLYRVNRERLREENREWQERRA